MSAPDCDRISFPCLIFGSVLSSDMPSQPGCYRAYFSEIPSLLINILMLPKCMAGSAETHSGDVLFGSGLVLPKAIAASAETHSSDALLGARLPDRGVAVPSRKLR